MVPHPTWMEALESQRAVKWKQFWSTDTKMVVENKQLGHTGEGAQLCVKRGFDCKGGMKRYSAEVDKAMVNQGSDLL